MTAGLAQKIRDLAACANPTEDRIDTILKEWDYYFGRLSVSIPEQEAEFDGVMRARVANGVISIVAPRVFSPVRTL